jgi:hypothetical protein
MMSQPGTPTSTLSLTTYPEPGIYTFFELRSIFKDRSKLQRKAQNDVVESFTVRLTLFRQYSNDFHNLKLHN